MEFRAVCCGSMQYAWQLVLLFAGPCILMHLGAPWLTRLRVSCSAWCEFSNLTTAPRVPPAPASAVDVGGVAPRGCRRRRVGRRRALKQFLRLGLRLDGVEFPCHISHGQTSLRQMNFATDAWPLPACVEFRSASFESARFVQLLVPASRAQSTSLQKSGARKFGRAALHV